MTATKRMVRQFKSLLVLAAVACAEWRPSQVKAAEYPGTQGDMKVSLVHEHKKASLAAISRKTQTMIVWDSDRPVWAVRIPSGSAQQKDFVGRSRLVQLAIPTGKQLSSTAVGFLPRSVHYFPGEERVIFKHDLTLGDFQVNVWNLRDTVTTCLEGKAAVGITGITPVSKQELVAIKQEGRVPTLVRLRLGDCSVHEESTADPDSEQAMFSGVFSNEEPVISPDFGTMAYFIRLPKTGPKVLILRRLNEERRVQRILVPENWLFWGARFSPDSRLVLVDTYRRDKSPGEPEARHRVLVYDVASGRLLRTIDIDARDGLAFSPDGRLLAAGTSSTEDTRFGGTRVKAIAVLYDFESGQELGRVEHPWLTTSPGMRGTLTGLEFSADGQYLITSTHDVRIWRIQWLKQKE